MNQIKHKNKLKKKRKQSSYGLQLNTWNFVFATTRTSNLASKKLSAELPIPKLWYSLKDFGMLPHSWPTRPHYCTFYSSSYKIQFWRGKTESSAESCQLQSVCRIGGEAELPWSALECKGMHNAYKVNYTCRVVIFFPLSILL